MKQKITKKETQRNKQDFLLTFFGDEPKYEEKEVNGFWLVKCWNGGTGLWNVMVYTKESLASRKTAQMKYGEQNSLNL
jgi:hypothetical protein